MVVRYNAMQRKQHLFFRPGPKNTFCGLSVVFGLPIAIGVICEAFRVCLTTISHVLYLRFLSNNYNEINVLASPRNQISHWSNSIRRS